MKKQLRKPENWQDFEALCKKLWGEVWGVPAKIKRNGRLGQPQSGVDVYAIPKGEEKYWGIQCKGKDEYTDATLTTVEIDKEIEKAKSFKPELAVFIIATTANKNAAIEQYIREKDTESRAAGGFEILLFCWEDIVDLIEDHRDTFNYYVNQQQYRDNYNLKVYFNEFASEITIRPKCLRTIRRYVLKKDKVLPSSANAGQRIDFMQFQKLDPFKDLRAKMYDNTNYALRPFEIIMVNEGNRVIEDWSVTIEVEKGTFVLLTDSVGKGPLGMVDIAAIQHKRTYAEGNTIVYRPLEDKPLVQKDNRFFKAWIEPLPKDYELNVKWTLIARDYNDTGTIKMIVSPKYEDSFIDIEVDTPAEVKENEVVEIKAKKPS